MELNIPQNEIMWKICNKYKKTGINSKKIKKQLGLSILEFANIRQAADSGEWNNFEEWYKEVTNGAGVNEKIGKQMSKKKVFNATLKLLAWNKKILKLN